MFVFLFACIKESNGLNLGKFLYLTVSFFYFVKEIWEFFLLKILFLLFTNEDNSLIKLINFRVALILIFNKLKLHSFMKRTQGGRIRGEENLRWGIFLHWDKRTDGFNTVFLVEEGIVVTLYRIDKIGLAF